MKRVMALTLSLILCSTMFMGCGSSTKDETATTTTTTTATTADTATTDAAVADTTTDAALPEGVLSEEEATLRIYAQYSDDDTKVPYDYAVKQLAIAYPNVKL